MVMHFKVFRMLGKELEEARAASRPKPTTAGVKISRLGRSFSAVGARQMLVMHIHMLHPRFLFPRHGHPSVVSVRVAIASPAPPPKSWVGWHRCWLRCEGEILGVSQRRI